MLFVVQQVILVQKYGCIRKISIFKKLYGATLKAIYRDTRMETELVILTHVLSGHALLFSAGNKKVNSYFWLLFCCRNISNVYMKIETSHAFYNLVNCMNPYFYTYIRYQIKLHETENIFRKFYREATASF
jgi:hypothetical protein